MWAVIILLINVINAQDMGVEVKDFKIFTANNSQPFFDFMKFDDKSQNIYIGGVDFVYQLFGSTLALKARSDNLSTIFNYSTAYANSVNKCKSLNQNQDACRNHIRIVQKLNSGQLYVCTTGAYSPQEYFLDENNLSVNSVGGRADTKCPDDPFTQNLFHLSGDYMYTALHVSSLGGFQICRVQMSSTSVTLKNDFILSDVDYIAVFEIENFIYFFFREISFLDPVLGTFQQSKVARVCKNDNGGTIYKYQFMTYSKARIACTINKTGKNGIVFNEMVDVQYDANRRVFYALFQFSTNSNFGSALCTYNYSSIEKVFNESPYVSYDMKTMAWNVIPSELVPNPRLSACLNDTKLLSPNQEIFAVTNFTLMSVVQQSNPIPPFSSNTLSLHKFTQLTFNSTHSIFYFVSDADRFTIKRSILNVFDVIPQKLSDWKLSTDVNLSTLRDITISNYDNVNYLYILYANAFFQVPVQACATYNYCTDCEADIMCTWQNNKCVFNQSESPDPLKTCAPYCSDSRAAITAIPGTSLTLPLVSKCRTSQPLEWFYNRTKIVVEDRFLLSDNSSFVILNYMASDAGRYQCVVAGGGVTLVEYDVQTSVCEFRDDIRAMVLSEFRNWCSAMDLYTNQYNKLQAC